MASFKPSPFVLLSIWVIVSAIAASACPTCEESPLPKHHGSGGKGGSSGPGGGPAGGSPAGGGGGATCPVSIVKLNVCSPLLGGILGSPVGSDCCALLGLLGVDVDICLCLALEANVLGIIDINIPRLDIIAKIVTACGRTLPPNFRCPA
ncbi:hypothetical protein KP509_27G037800 [Ceratopteris richardii]|uniref:Hydrophobic seed protein domain-containing protein n=1 Tax=Ceratopteris richardii TaxID=49495 RepID=A0A8T2RHD9_CERRI|nr:hypothetical protein KP509_27G037800 [Ceratopteris richardii]